VPTWAAPGTKPAFAGVCKKDLAGAVIIHSINGQDMSRQYRAFEDRVKIAAGKVGSAVVIAMERKKSSRLHISNRSNQTKENGPAKME